MARAKKDKEREQRIALEIITDAHDSEEQAIHSASHEPHSPIDVENDRFHGT